MLTTITQLDPAYVNFSITDAELREFRAFNDSLDKPLSDDDITVTLQYGDGTTYPKTGKIIMSSQNVDLRTGTVQIRSVFPNADGAHPARPVRAADHQGHHAAEGDRHSAAGGLAGSARHLRLCGQLARARPKCAPVKLDREVGNGWIVREGLNDGDRIIVDGVMRVRPGAPVKASPYEPKQAGQQAAKAAAPPGAGQRRRNDLEILHRPAGLRLRHLDHHRHGGPAGDARRCRSRSIRRSFRPK